VEAKAWQAFYATLLLERSKFGLNELLGREALDCKPYPNSHSASGKRDAPAKITAEVTASFG
jgi:hypothetical protein